MELRKVLLKFVNGTFSKYLREIVLQKDQWKTPFQKHPLQGKAIMETTYSLIMKVLLKFIDCGTVPRLAIPHVTLP